MMRDRFGVPRLDLLRVAAYLVSLFVALPVLIVITASLTRARFITFPPQGLTLRWYGEVLSDARLMGALRISVTVAAMTAVLAVVFGLGASYALDRYRFRGRNAISTFIMAPLVLPSIVLALGMIFFMTAIGLIRTVPSLVLGHLVIALPFAVRALSAAMGGVNLDVERSAAVLGAPPLVVLYRITIPLLRPGIIAALMFSFLASFNNVSISLFIAGPRTQTLPLEIFRLAQDVSTPNVAALASIVTAFTTAVVLVLEKKFNIYGVLERQTAI